MIVELDEVAEEEEKFDGYGGSDDVFGFGEVLRCVRSTSGKGGPDGD